MNTITLKKRKGITIPEGFIKQWAKQLKCIRIQTFFIYVAFFMLSVILISLFDKETLHVALNRYHSAFFDTFFKYATFLGDGVMFGVLVIVFFFIKKRMALVFGVAGILTLLITHLFKQILFRGLPRPAEFIGVENLHLVEGVKMAFWNTFPSGHTTTAFAIFTILCLYFNKCKSQYVWVSLAIIAGLSRVYLSLHFWLDIFVGSFIGIFIGFLSMVLISKSKRIVH